MQMTLIISQEPILNHTFWIIFTRAVTFYVMLCAHLCPISFGLIDVKQPFLWYNLPKNILIMR